MKSFTLVALLFLFSLSTTVTSQTIAIEKTDVNKDIKQMQQGGHDAMTTHSEAQEETEEYEIQDRR